MLIIVLRILLFNRFKIIIISHFNIIINLKKPYNMDSLTDFNKILQFQLAHSNLKYVQITNTCD